MNIILEHPVVPCTKETIVAFETEFKIKFSEDYCDFLLQYNGGKPEKNIFDYQDDGGANSSTVRQFLTLGTGSDSLAHYLEIYEGRIPQNALPVAYDDGGNLICLVFEPTGSTPVVFWDHDQEGEVRDETIFYFIAESFKDFCKNLHGIDER